jgi:hypothetical protein
MKKYSLILGLFCLLVVFSACSKRGQCPAYMDFNQGTISVQDKGKSTPDDIRAQSQKLLNTQDSYIQVVRDKKTGLVKSKRRVKKGKNNAYTDKGFKVDPRSLQGVK